MAVNKLPQTQEEMDLFLDDVFRYLYTEWGTCENCGETGEIEDWQDEGETDAND
jgi:hypothetical protein